MSFITRNAFPDIELADHGAESPHILPRAKKEDEGLDADHPEDLTLDDSAHILVSLHNSEHSEGMLSNSRMSVTSTDLDLSSADLDRMLLGQSNHTIDSASSEHGYIMRADSLRSRDHNDIGPRRRRGTQPPSTTKRIKFNDINFDPAPSNFVAPQNHQAFQRRVSCNNEDTSSQVSNPSPFSQPSPRRQNQVAVDKDIARSLIGLSSSHPNSCPQRQVALDSGVNHRRTNLSQPKLRRVNTSGAEQEISYEDALQKLADSIKLTKQSRQQLMAHGLVSAPALLRHDQSRQFVTSAQHQLKRVAATPAVSRRPRPAEYRSELLPDDRFPSMPAAFFSGSRGTLTNELEHSRTQLKMIMDMAINQNRIHP